MSVEVTPQDFPEIRWYGHWVWLPEEPVTAGGMLSASIDPLAPETHGLFRKRLHLEQVPDRVPARITADSRYALFAVPSSGTPNAVSRFACSVETTCSTSPILLCCSANVWKRAFNALTLRSSPAT